MKLVLVVLICLGVLTLTSSGAPSTILQNCCYRHTDRVPILKNIQDYKHQIKGRGCKKTAVIFITWKGKQICSNPNNKQVKDLIDKLSKRIRMYEDDFNSL